MTETIRERAEDVLQRHADLVIDGAGDRYTDHAVDVAWQLAHDILTLLDRQPHLDSASPSDRNL